MSIKVIIAGFKGKMGQAAYKMVTEDPELVLAGLLDPFTDEKEVAGVPVFNTKEELAGLQADVWIDFTTPKVAYENTRFALENGFAPVVGTTGLQPKQPSIFQMLRLLNCIMTTKKMHRAARLSKQLN